MQIYIFLYLTHRIFMVAIRPNPFPGACMFNLFFSKVQKSRAKSIGLSAAIIGTSALTFLAGCQVEDKGASEPIVETLNQKYSLLRSHVLVRRVKIPTEGYLDYAAYSKNIMLVDPTWKAIHPTKRIAVSGLDFGGKLIEVKSVLDFTPLTDAEKNRPLAWTPALDHLLKWNFEKASALANSYSAISGEKWGDTTDMAQPFQEFGALYIHTKGNLKEVWVEIEFKPWLNSFMDGILDQDRDGYPEVFARLDPRVFTNEMVDEITRDYTSKPLTEVQVLEWARNLASRWYPSYNTDLMELKTGSSWPYDDTPAKVKAEMAGLMVSNPLVILKGRPFEDTLFNVLVVDSMGIDKTPDQKREEGVPVVRGLDKGLSARLEAITARIDEQLQTYGKGKWLDWINKLAPFQEDVRRFAQQEPKEVLGLVAENKTLVFRRELEYLLAADLALPSRTQHPITEIAAFKDYLAAQGIDFLFVPIPTKLDVYPEIITPTADSLLGHIPQPYLSKVIRDLAEARVETVDLLSPFLKLKSASESGKRDLYQRQDTHWTTVGLETAAQVLAERIQLYSWYDQAFRDKRDYRIQDSTFENLGDIQAALSDAKKAGVAPEQVLGHQVMEANGNLYQNSDSSSVLVLGDSYTGVFETVGCRHAGVTAHLAKGLGAPVDLIMGWGGGPEAPGKLKKRGEAALKGKRLVVWMMSARDLFVYPGDWSVK